MTALSDDLKRARPPYHLPPRLRTASGAVRRVGLELEFAGLTFEQTLDIVQRYVPRPDRQSEPQPSSSASLRATLESEWGTFRVELDSEPLRDRSYLKPLASLGIEEASAAGRAIEEAVLDVARELVPLEIVTPPIPWTDLDKLDELWLALRDAGAEGTNTSILHAFGLHINPEAPDDRVETTLAILQSYLLLEDWLVETLDVNLTRHVVPYIRGFPEEYRRLVLAPDYRPDWSRFLTDYVWLNPTRNRRLDLLPLIVEVTGCDLAGRVREWELVQPRPAYHYRLPNCEITRPGWTPAYACNGWVLVERLAEDAALREAMARAYLDTTDWPLRIQRGGWVEQVRAAYLPRLTDEKRGAS